MKIAVFFLAIISFSLSAAAQSGNYTISGKIIDAVTKNPMQAASVFAQNTTTGTATDANGNFTLRLPNGGYDLVITFTGYQTVSRRITMADADNNNIVIEVKQKENEMEDVVVKASNEVKDGPKHELKYDIGNTMKSRRANSSRHYKRLHRKQCRFKA